VLRCDGGWSRKARAISRHFVRNAGAALPSAPLLVLVRRDRPTARRTQRYALRCGGHDDAAVAAIATVYKA
jgi:hypothetical protein